MLNPDDYKTGIASFHDEVVGEFEVIKSALISSTYGLNVSFEVDEDGIKFKVKNNSGILPAEQERINRRIAVAVAKDHFAEIYNEIEDDTEGAGLGIALIILFLKCMAIDPGNFTIKTDGEVTITCVKIPFDIHPVEIVTLVKKQIMDEINGLPTFPENVIKLLDMCSQPDASIEDIVANIKLDLSLTTDVIKLANSAGFIAGNRIEDVNMAVMKIGLKNVRDILLASNARKIMESRYSKFEEIWDHCNRVAFYAKLIAMRYNFKNAADNAFLAGLLHDLGQVILLAVDMNSVKKIAKLVNDRNIVTSTVMEEISIGISHAEIGGMVAEKWNFPEYLSNSIRYHHSPQSSAQEFQDITYIVYLANQLCGVENRKYYYYYLEDAVLEQFSLKTESDVSQLHDYLKEQYSIFEKGQQA